MKLGCSRHTACPTTCLPTPRKPQAGASKPSLLAAKTTVPVLGVPMPSKHLSGVDSLHSIVQMPKGIPVATFAIGAAGAANAALFSVAMLANEDAKLRAKLDAYRDEQTATARNLTLPPTL